MIGRHVGSASRALTIAITEQNRAMSFSSIERYKEAGLQKMEWAVSDPCNICAKNDGQVIQIGQSFASGDQQPPAHPHCRCVLLPVIPGMEDDPAGIDGTVTTPTTGADGAITNEPLIPTTTSSTEWQPVDETGWVERQNRYRLSRGLTPLNDNHLRIAKDQFDDASIILEKGNVTVLLDKKLTTVTDEMLDGFLTNFDEVYEKLPAWRKYNPDGTPRDFLLLIKEGVEGTKGNVNAYTYLGHDTIWFSAKTVRSSILPPRILTQQTSFEGYRLPNGNRTRWSMPAAYGVNENKYTIAHELGHDVDSISNNGVRGKFIGGLRRKYKDGDFWSAYGTEDAKEAYAEVFAQWLLGEQTPVTQAFAERFGWNLGLQEYWDLMPDELQWRAAMRLTGQG
jgi:SPP1 gp7 family putative phage head morphogenesis protein